MQHCQVDTQRMLHGPPWSLSAIIRRPDMMWPPCKRDEGIRCQRCDRKNAELKQVSKIPFFADILPSLFPEIHRFVPENNIDAQQAPGHAL